MGKDYTRFEVVAPDGTTEPLAKRRAMLHMVKALVDRGVPPAIISDVLPNAKFLDIEGEHTDRDDIVAGFIARWPNATVDNVKRWFVDEPIVGGDRTWLLSSRWGRTTETMLDELAKLVPDGSFSVEAVG